MNVLELEEKKLNKFQLGFKSKNPNTIIPSNLGAKWSESEENILLGELHDDIDIETIANNHNRTKGSIISRQKEIAYKLFNKNIHITDIVNKTKLHEITIHEFIEKKRNNTSTKKSIKENKIEEEKFSIENEIIYIKKDIANLKNMVSEILELMKAVYDFEDT
jgi:hypothetical protein